MPKNLSRTPCQNEIERGAMVDTGCEEVAGVGQHALGGYRREKRGRVLRQAADAGCTRAGATKRPRTTHTGWGGAAAWWLTSRWRDEKRRAMVARVSGRWDRLMPLWLGGVRREEKRRAAAASDRRGLGHAWNGAGGASHPPPSPLTITGGEHLRALGHTARTTTHKPPKPPRSHNPFDADSGRRAICSHSAEPENRTGIRSRIGVGCSGGRAYRAKARPCPAEGRAAIKPVSL